jgi:hypothetical protein
VRILKIEGESIRHGMMSEKCDYNLPAFSDLISNSNDTAMAGIQSRISFLESWICLHSSFLGFLLCWSTQDVDFRCTDFQDTDAPAHWELSSSSSALQTPQNAIEWQDDPLRLLLKEAL